MAAIPQSLQDSINATKVTYRKLGKSGLTVSVPIFGAMSLGDPDSVGWTVGEPEALELLKHAYDAGLNTWDTADVYSAGASESIIGSFFKKYDVPRRKVVVMTKCYWGVGETPDVHRYVVPDAVARAKDYANAYGLSRAAIFGAVDASLARLGTDYIDVLQIHRFDYDTPVEETMKALHDLVEMGKVRYLGASSMWATQFAQMQFVAEKNGWTKFVAMQNHYNLLYREEEREMNRFCNATGVGLIPWSPLCRGHLCRPPSDFGTTARSAQEKAAGPDAVPTFGVTGPHVECDRVIIARVKELADQKGWTMTQVALAWINRKVTSPIVGFSSVARIDEALAANGKELTVEEMRSLEAPYQPKFCRDIEDRDAL